MMDAVLERVWYHNNDPSWKDAHTKRCPKCRGRVVTRKSQWWQKKDTTTNTTTTANTANTTTAPTTATSSSNARYRDSYETLLIRDDEKACINIKSTKIVEDCKCGANVCWRCGNEMSTGASVHDFDLFPNPYSYRHCCNDWRQWSMRISVVVLAAPIALVASPVIVAKFIFKWARIYHYARLRSNNKLRRDRDFQRSGDYKTHDDRGNPQSVRGARISYEHNEYMKGLRN